MKTELVIPGGITSVLQSMDVSISKPFKDRLSHQYMTWIEDPAHELTETGKIKRAVPSESVHVRFENIQDSVISYDEGIMNDITSRGDI
jgi:hypothetical protein